MGLKKYHAVLISSNDFWVYDPDSYDSKTKLYGDFTVVKGDSKKDDSDTKRCSYFFEVGNADNHGFKPNSIKYDDAEGFLVIEGEQAPMNKVKRRVFQIGEEARRYKNMRGPRHSVDAIVVSKDSKKQEIKEYLKNQQDDSKSAETFQADTLNQINPIFVEGAEDVMGAESEIFCADCGGRRKYDAESLSADAYNKDGSFKFPKPYVDCEGCGLQEDGNCDCYLDEEMIKDAKKGICPSCEYDNFNINKPCEECEVVINRDGPKYRMDAESFEAEHSCGCGDEMALEAELIGAKAKGKKFLRVGDLKKALKKTKDTDKVIAGDLYDEKVYLTTKVFKDGNQVAIVGQDGYHYYDDHMDDWDAEDDEIAYKIVEQLVDADDNDLLIEVAKYLGIGYGYEDRYNDMDILFDEVEKTIKNAPKKYLYQLDKALMEDMNAEEVEGEILDMVEQEGGALGMQNLTGIADENVIQETISDMKEDGSLFEHKHGDYYTHEPVEAETFEAQSDDLFVLTFSDPMRYGKMVQLPFTSRNQAERYVDMHIRPYNKKRPHQNIVYSIKQDEQDEQDVVDFVQEISPFPMGKLFASFIVVGVSAIAGAKLLNR
jgi:hypothetical protein